MQNLGYYNGKYDLIENMTVPMTDRVHWFGDGVYDATCARNYKIMSLDEHIERFFNSAKLLHINLGFSKDYLADLLQKLVLKLDEGDLFVYWQVTRGGKEIRSHCYDEGEKANLWVTITPEKVTKIDKKFKLTMMEDKRYKYCNIKTLNLIPSVLAAQLAKERGCDETVLHRGEIVTECAHSNIHILKNGKFITHPADEYILAGIARAHLIETCRALNIAVEERAFTLEELFNADEIIVTSSGDLCNSAYELDGRQIGGKDKETLSKMQKYIIEKWLDA